MAAQRNQVVEGHVIFHALNNIEHSFVAQTGMAPVHTSFLCGACGHSTSGRVVCDLVRPGGKSTVQWCLCSCDKMEPTLIVRDVDNNMIQIPVAREFHSGANWPPDLAKLYEEAAIAYAAGAFTASGMVARKILMACACHEGDDDGKTFAKYVDYILDKVLLIPKARAAIDKIRNIGNDANHKLDFITQDSAKRAMQIVTYLLDALYSLPAA